MSLYLESSPLVLAVTRHQELLLSSLSEVVAFLQGQQVAAVLEREEEGKHTAYLTLAQSTLNTAEVSCTCEAEERLSKADALKHMLCADSTDGARSTESHTTVSCKIGL